MARTLLSMIFCLNTLPLSALGDTADFCWAGIVEHINPYAIVINDRSFLTKDIINITLDNDTQADIAQLSNESIFGVVCDIAGNSISLWQITQKDIPAYLLDSE